MKEPKWAWNKEFKYNDKEKELLESIKKFLDRPLSPRWIYYGLYDEPNAKQMKELNNILNKSRKDKNKILDRDMIVDDTRTPTIWKSYIDASNFLERIKNQYTKDIWNNQPEYVEVWIEDQASAEAVKRSPRHILQRFRINVRATKGFNSLGAVWEAYKYLNEMDKPIKILYFGDLNPSGWAIPIILVRQFQELGLNIELKRIGLNPEQLSQFNIPAFTKISGDPRRAEFNKIFGYEEWEKEPLQKYLDEKTKKWKEGKKHLNIDLEKIPIKQFEDLLEESIKENIDLDNFQAIMDEEDFEIEEIKKKLGDTEDDF